MAVIPMIARMISTVMLPFDVTRNSLNQDHVSSHIPHWLYRDSILILAALSSG